MEERPQRQRKGQAAETLARRHLEAAGLRTLARNWRCRAGELDLVMEDGETLVIVEVRCRSHPGYGGAAASVDGRKRRRLARAALAFLQARGEAWGRPLRFDVVAIGADGRPDWIRDAFRPEES